LIYYGKEYCFEGIVNGNITEIPIGDNGFGYDSIFRPDGYKETFAQLSMNKKNKISHRALAINKLIDFLKKN
jgi:XTP/dITP diphosphohydrolase